jgi:hypothetical protein
MHRLVLALSGMALAVSAESAWCAEAVPLDAYAGPDPVYLAEVCWPLPPSYPRGWEIVIHTPCPPGYYLPYAHRANYRYRSSHDHYRSTYVAGPIHRRPYLRPGWWW